MINHQSSTYKLKKQAKKSGFITLAEEGMRRVLEGSTALEEVSRVVDLGN